jgi:hypothetical protein
VQRAAVGRLADMVTVRACRLDMKGYLHLISQVPQHPFRRGRAADVAGADE